jgi:hypothetical protein
MQHEDCADVVRAKRFELIDGSGRIRAVLGSTPRSGHQEEVFGLELFDSHGGARAWLSHEERFGARLAFAISGNQVLIIGTSDLDADIPAGARLTVCDLDGAPVIDWHMAR